MTSLSLGPPSAPVSPQVCLFCGITRNKPASGRNNVLLSSNRCSVFENIRQNHMLEGGVALLVVPDEHQPSLDQLHAQVLQKGGVDTSDKKRLIALLHRLKRTANGAVDLVLQSRPSLRGASVQMFFNMGYACSQPHLHLHVIIGTGTLRARESLPTWLLSFRIGLEAALNMINKDQLIHATALGYIPSGVMEQVYGTVTGRRRMPVTRSCT